MFKHEIRLLADQSTLLLLLLLRLHRTAKTATGYSIYHYYYYYYYCDYFINGVFLKKLAGVIDFYFGKCVTIVSCIRSFFIY